MNRYVVAFFLKIVILILFLIASHIVMRGADGFLNLNVHPLAHCCSYSQTNNGASAP